MKIFNDNLCKFGLPTEHVSGWQIVYIHNEELTRITGIVERLAHRLFPGYDACDITSTMVEDRLLTLNLGRTFGLDERP